MSDENKQGEVETPNAAATPPTATPNKPTYDPFAPRRSPWGLLFLQLLLAAGGLWAGTRWPTQLGAWFGHATTSDAETAKEVVTYTCSMHPQVKQPGPGLCPICHMELTPMRAGGSSTDPGDAGLVRIDPVLVQNMGLRLARVRSGPLVQSVRAVGTLVEAEPRVRDVNLLVSGWVRKLHAHTEGMAVAAGAPLFELYSPELQVGIEEWIAARTAAEAGGGGAAEALRDAARQKLLLWGLAPAQIEALAQAETAPETVVFTSPFDGVVTERAVVVGAMVRAGERVLRIADLRALWLDVRVFEQHLAALALGQAVRIELGAFPGEAFAGSVVFVHPVVDPVSRTALVRIEVGNEDLRLKPGMYGTAYVEAGSKDDVTLAPREAVIDTGRNQHVYLAKGEGRFEPRAVRLGRSGDDGVVEVREGLVAGDVVVVSGQFLIDTESRLQEVHLKLRPQTEAERKGQAPPGKSLDETAQTALRPHVDATLREYLALAAELGKEADRTEPIAPEALMVAAAALRTAGAGSAGASLTAEVATAAERLAEVGIETQRERFKALSDAVVLLLEVCPPSAAVAEKIFVMHCPMAPGTWLQQGATLANPYYATDMKECGDVIKTIEAKR